MPRRAILDLHQSPASKLSYMDRMFWLVDLDHALAEGTVTASAAAALKKRAREALVAGAINAALFAGVIMVIGGTAAWLGDNRTLAALGAALAVIGVLAILSGNQLLQFISNAVAIIGVSLAVVAAGDQIFERAAEQLFLPLTALGLPIAVFGGLLRGFKARSFAVVGGWMILLGIGAHLTGLLMTKSDLGLDWLALLYAGVAIAGCGIFLNIRFVTALSMIPFAAALSSRTFYGHAYYGVSIYEVTLTTLQMTLMAGLALLVSMRSSERMARHARIIGQLSLIWANMALWIGSLWGDVVGYYLWGPRWIDGEDYSKWEERMRAFHAQTLYISPDIFAAIWALVIVAVGAWGAYTARRAVINIAMTFGAIHFYTQYFERFSTSPGTIAIAGIIAILAAWGLWTANRRFFPPARPDKH